MLGIMIRVRNVLRSFKISTYRHYCPVCERRVKEFLALPEFYRVEAQLHGCTYSVDDAETLNYKQYSCPHCHASDRDRLYALYIKEKAAGQNNNRRHDLVEFAPFQPLGQMIRKFGVFNLRTADLFMEGVDDKVNLEDLSIYLDASFDGFICSHVLEHVTDDRKALRELQRILKPGGWGILMVPILLSIDDIDEDPNVTDESERWRRFGQNDHVRIYSKRGFLQRVEEAGFSVRQYGWQHFGADLFIESGIAQKSVLYIVEKAGDSPALPQETA